MPDPISESDIDEDSAQGQNGSATSMLKIHIKPFLFFQKCN